MSQAKPSGTIAVVGGGPAGAMAASLLSAAGHKTCLFEEKLAWEKPCGGGLTHKALARYPFLADAEVERNWVEGCELISPRGRRAWFSLDQPIAIFSRRVLNRLLLDRAENAGAEIVRERVIGIDGRPGAWSLRTSEREGQANYVILAGGARNSLRVQFRHPLAPADLMATFGYYIPLTGNSMQIKFARGLEGYIWVFPRRDHLSAGICGKLNGRSTAELRRMLDNFLQQQGIEFAGAEVYAHLLP